MCNMVVTEYVTAGAPSGTVGPRSVVIPPPFSAEGRS